MTEISAKTEVLLKHGKCWKDGNLKLLKYRKCYKDRNDAKNGKFWKDGNLRLLKDEKCWKDGNLAKISLYGNRKTSKILQFYEVEEILL